MFAHQPTLFLKDYLPLRLKKTFVSVPENTYFRLFSTAFSGV
jgi:hypothetical protein